MRFTVLLFALLMPVVAWMNQRGVFGPTNGEVSDRYPTLLVAAGYAFSIWGLIFALDIVYALTQAFGRHRRDRALTLAAMPAAAGFMFTLLWMPLFSMGLFWLCLGVIFAALACMAVALMHVVRHGRWRTHYWAQLALGLHTGWLTLAAFINLAQVIVAFELLPTERMLGWSMGLFAAAFATLLMLNRLFHGQLAFVAAAVWGLVAMYVKQSQSTLPGAGTMAAIALGAVAVLVVHALVLRRGHARELAQRPASH